MAQADKGFEIEEGISFLNEYRAWGYKTILVDVFIMNVKIKDCST